MNGKQLVKRLAPPIVIDMFRRVHHQLNGRPTLGASRAEYEYIPDGWAYAATHPEIKGWDVEEVLETYKRKWPKFVWLVQRDGPLGVAHESELDGNSDLCSHNIVMTFAYVLALASRHRPVLTMLDWGGGIGHYYVLAAALLRDHPIEYHCKDVSLFATYGATLFPEQHFHADESCLESTYDLVMASGSLQYSEDWRRVLLRLGKATRGYLFITRIPVVQQVRSFVFVQRPYSYGYNTEFLGWCFNRGEVLDTATEAGLVLEREFVSDHQSCIQGAPEQNACRGYLFRRPTLRSRSEN